MKVKVISLPYIFQVLYVLCFTRSRYQVSVYRTNGTLVFVCFVVAVCDLVDDMKTIFEPRREKTGFRGFRPGPTQTGLYGHRRWLEA